MNDRFSPLSNLVANITEKVAGQKDSTKPYVGLEHIPSAGSSLLGFAAASDSISTNNVFRAGDTLFGKLRPQLRKSVRVDCDGYCSTDILVLRALSSVDAEFAAKIIQFDTVFREAIRTEEGTKMPRTSWHSIKNALVPSPPLPEQRKIARILTTLENLIEKTKALIAKYQAIKQGMMHDLFTRGVDEHGHLRPSHAEAPNLYKQSELGWIPKEWEVVRCDEICREIIVGIVVRPVQYYQSEGVPVLRSANVREEGLDRNDLVFMSERSNQMLIKSQLHTGDVVTVRTGYPGTSCVVPSEFDGANCVDILISRSGPRVRPHFLAIWINSDSGKNQVLRKQGGLAQQHFNVGELKDLLVVLPVQSEQERIQSLLLRENNLMGRELANLNKMKLLKAGLMQDLLTGKVRVKVDEAVEAAAHA